MIFGMMLFSFPIGMLVVFHSDIGQDINFELPLGALDEIEGTELGPLSQVELGDVFLVIWSMYAVLFAIAILGPKAGFMGTVSPMLSGNSQTGSNYMLEATKWFSILILVSAIITLVQDGFGISTVPPQLDNDLIQFFYVSVAPLVEEVGFRVILVGLPLFVLYNHRSGVRGFFGSLWHPSSNLRVQNPRNALTVIVLAGALFGLAHIVTGEPWSEGKFAQATAGGIILGWVYFRFGFVAALLIHWATNYFIFAYVNVLAHVNEISVDAAFSHSLVTTMEVMFLISGILSVAVIISRYCYKQQSQV